MESVIGEQAAPDERPKGIDRLAGVAAAESVMERLKERCTGTLEVIEDLLFAFTEWFCGNSGKLETGGAGLARDVDAVRWPE